MSRRTIRSTRPVALAVAFLVGAVAVLFLGAGPAAAHAELDSSDPAQGATVHTMPREVTLTFSEAVGRPAAVSVVGPNGTDLVDGDLLVADNTVRAAIGTAAAPAGEYTISYQLVSADGHPVSGMVRFELSHGRSAPATPAPSPPASETGVSPGLVAGLLTGLVLALGLVVVGLSRLVSGAPDD